jgi:hypothetical protein
MFFEHVQLIFRSCSSNLPIVFILSTHHVHFPLMFIFPSCSFPSHAHLSQLISVHHALLPPSPPPSQALIFITAIHIIYLLNRIVVVDHMLDAGLDTVLDTGLDTGLLQLKAIDGLNK